MSSTSTALAGLLGKVQRPGDFYATGSTEIFTPSPGRERGRSHRPAAAAGPGRATHRRRRTGPYGHGEETWSIPPCGGFWQIDAGRVRIEGRHWSRDLETIVKRAATGLGVTQPVVAEFLQTAGVRSGQLFVSHRDTEKAPGMFATLIIVLP
ncbi:MAG: hypothetical protein IPP10_16360 [Candidatus Competibacteraceae bacterium]|nr:hypothetical protein [Candidatus Competibacteraceae bacterium]